MKMLPLGYISHVILNGFLLSYRAREDNEATLHGLENEDPVRLHVAVRSKMAPTSVSVIFGFLTLRFAGDSWKPNSKM